MKNQKLLTAIIAVILFSIAVVVVVSCQKQTVSETNDQNLIDEKSKEVTQRVLDFREQMEYYWDNPNMKTGGDMQADSALLYIEATLNYSYSFPWYQKYEIEFIESLHDTVLSATDVLLSDQRVSQLYLEIEEQVRDDYIACGFPDKKLLNVDLSFYSNGQGGYQIKTITIITKAYPGGSPPELWEPPYDDWKYGYERGYCDGTDSDDDAGIVLTSEINNEMNPYNGDIKYYVFNGTVVTFPYYDYPNPYSEDDNYKDYYIFYARNFGGLTIGEEEECVDGGEMYYYKINTVRIFEDYLADHPELVFNECWIVGKYYDTGFPDYKLVSIEHITSAEFGIWIPRDEGDLPVDISSI